MKETQEDMQKVTRDYQLTRDKISEASRYLTTSAKKVRFDKKYQNILDWLAFLIGKLEELVANDESHAIMALMQQNNFLVTTLQMKLVLTSLAGLAEKIPEAAKEVERIKGQLRHFEELEKAAEEGIKKRRKEQADREAADKEKAKADAERLKHLEGSTYH